MANSRLMGVELYFEDVDSAKRFYRDILGLAFSDEAAGHYAKFECGGTFVCLERKGAESYTSRDKAVLFLEVRDLQATLETIGRDKLVHFEPRNDDRRPPWTVLHDPEGHDTLLLEARASTFA